LISSAHFGAIVFGSDIDGRSLRGKGFKLGSSPQDQKTVKGVKANFRQYGLVRNYLGSFAADVTHSPLRGGRWLDGILCDPPYGVREGLKVLGSKKEREGQHYIDGKPAYLSPDYIPPKKPYSLDALLADILDLAAEKLADGGRLAMWMPTANQRAPQGDEKDGKEVEIAIPQNRYLKLSSVCVQPFHKCKHFSS
jgi:tRNA (guanine10-N2)-methyltransferase